AAAADRVVNHHDELAAPKTSPPIGVVLLGLSFVPDQSTRSKLCCYGCSIIPK
ncbi:hypothetical protein A2U01_0084296, partial [Trifolium medium]|nr:hypothetical protein [Trifolium medium]